MGSHSVICRPTDNRLHPNRRNRAGWYSIYRPRKNERLSWPSWLVTYRNGLPVHRRSPIRVLTGSDVAQHLLLSANLSYTNGIIIIIIITLIEANALLLSQTANQSAGSPKCSGFILLSASVILPSLVKKRSRQCLYDNC